MDKDKINFDLEFLEKNTKEKPKEQPKSKDPNWVFHKDQPKEGMKSFKLDKKHSKKTWLWGLGVVVVIIILASSSGDSGSSSTSGSTTKSYSNTDSGMVQVGNYMCSSYAAGQADNLEPSSFTKSQIEAEYDRVEAMGNARESEKADLDSTYVDDTDQYEIDSYNQRVRAYNAGYQTYSDAYDSWEVKKNAYNAQVDTYNNYLRTHCTPN